MNKLLPLLLLPLLLFSQPNYTETFTFENMENSPRAYVFDKTSNNEYIIAGGEGWLWKVANNGNSLWDGPYTNSVFQCLKVVEDAFIIGKTIGYSGSVLKLDTEGNIIFDNEIYDLGAFFDIAILDDPSVNTDEASNYMIVGGTGPSGGGSWDAKISEIASDNGNELWTDVYCVNCYDNGVLGDEMAESVINTGDGILVAGYLQTGGTGSYGPQDAFLRKYDYTMDHIWTQVHESDDNHTHYHALANTTDGNIIGVGFYSTGELNSIDLDVWVVKSDSNGETIWETTFDGERALDVVVTESNEYIIGGISDNGSVFVMMLDSSGNTIWEETIVSNTGAILSNQFLHISDDCELSVLYSTTSNIFIRKYSICSNQDGEEEEETDSSLVGDVNCDGDITLFDAQMVVSILLEEWDELGVSSYDELLELYPCAEGTSTESNSESLEEVLDILEEISDNTESGPGFNLFYPDGYHGEPIVWDSHFDGYYIVPEGKNLYITNCRVIDGWDNLFLMINSQPVIRGGHMNGYDNKRLTQPLIVSEGDTVFGSFYSPGSIPENNAGSGSVVFNGLLVNKSVQPITHDLISDGDFEVPSGKILYITYFREDYLGTLWIDDLDGVDSNHKISAGYMSSGTYKNLHQPIIAGPSSVISIQNTNGNSNESVFNGYLVDEDYFSVSNNVSSSENTNSNSLTLSGDTLSFGNQSLIIPGISSIPAQVGQYRDGGIVFYVDGTGQHGLVCDISDLGVYNWGGSLCYSAGQITDLATGTGGGLQNTLDIVNHSCSEEGEYAAEACYNLVKNGYDDWYLPNIEELELMFQYKDAINENAINYGGNNFIDDYYTGYYWSSTEHPQNNWGYAYRLNFETGDESGFNRTWNWGVRAIRQF